MSQAALRVPLGFVPRAPQGSAQAWESVWIDNKSDTGENGVENDAWDEDGDETAPHASCTASYYLAQAPGTGAGEVYIAVGYSEGTVRVFAAPVDKNTPPAQDDVHERPVRHAHGHRRSSRTTLPGSTSPYSPSSASIWPPMSDVTPSDATTKTSASTASSSISPSSPTHTSVSDGPTQSMSQDVAQFTPKHENAEALLEAQYHATASPCVIAHSGEARQSHVHEHHDAPKHRDRLHSLWERRSSGGMSDPAPLSDGPSEVPSVEPVIDTHLVRAPLLVRSLYTPDASRVTALLVDDRPNDAVLPAQLLVQQASGRVTAWSLPLLQFLGTVQLRVMQHSAPGAEHEVQFVFERQATELGSQLLQPVDAYMHMARLTPCAAPTLVLHPLPVLGSSEQVPLLTWAEYKEWPSRIFVLRTDPVRSTLAVCAVLHAPDVLQRTLCLSLEDKPHLLLYAAGDELVRETYALGDLTQFCQGLSMPAPRPAPNGAPSGTSTPVHAPPGRLSLKHLGLLLPAWTMPKHEPTVSHESSREEMLAPLPDAHKRRLTELVTTTQTAPETSQRALAEATVLAAAVVGSTCALALHASESALLLVDGELEQPYLHLLPSRPISLLPMERTGSLGVLCQIQHTDHIQCTAEVTDAPPNSLAVAAAGSLLSVPLADTKPDGTHTAPSAVLPLSLTKVILAECKCVHANAATGLISMPLTHLFSDTPLATAQPLPWDAPLTLLQQVANPRTGTRHILGGSAAGDIALWNVSSLQLEAAWSWFASPIQCIVPLLGVSPISRLYSCVLCVAQDGTSALLALDDLRLVQMFPGCGAPLVQIAVRGSELLLAYGERRARIWSLSSQELVRSATAEQLWMLVAQADEAGEAWLRLPVPPAPRSAPGRVDKSAQSGMLSACGAVAEGAVPIILADIRKALDVACKTLRPALGASSLSSALDAYTRHMHDEASARTEAPLADEAAAAKLLTTLWPLFALFLPSDLDQVFAQLQEKTCEAQTPAIVLVPGALGLPGFVSEAAGDQATRSSLRFCLTPEASAQHLLTLTTLLLLASAVPSVHHACRSVLDALLTPAFLASAVGSDAFAPPSLAVLAQFIMDENEVLRTAAALLFRAYAAAASESELARLATVYAPVAYKLDADEAPLAVLLLGLVASARYAYFSPALLKQISVGVAQYLAAPVYRPEGARRAYVALELCCHGCGIWQHYVDAIALVRGIFCIATQPEEAAAGDHAPAIKLSGLSLRGLARRATLELAAKHSALFMSTLAMDILHATSVEQGQVTLRLVAFMIRQKPLVLYPSLPRLVEAVVKSLDPTAGAMRTAMAKSATLMINELVKTYPSIAFHGQSQRLAVGTHEGHVVLYDLKTATRLYVLDGHSHPVTACSFSPDGRRFLSMSLEDECVLIWRLSTGLMDMLVPSAMSRLTGAHSQASADRVLHFHLGATAELCPADTLTEVSFEWPNSRSVRLRVGEAHVNLGVV